SCGLRERTVLAPTGHAAVDELRIALQAHVGAEPQALRDAWTEALEEPVCTISEPEDELDAALALQIHADRSPIAREHIAGTPTALRDPVDTDHFRAHIGEHHSAERARPDACKLDDADAVQRPHRCLPYFVF